MEHHHHHSKKQGLMERRQQQQQHPWNRKFIFGLQLWSLVLVIGWLGNVSVGGDSSPPVADVEDLFKDEGFLRMSRGGEAFGRRPPPPLILNPPPHLTQPPPTRIFQTTPSTLYPVKDKASLIPMAPSSPFYNNRHEAQGNSSEKHVKIVGQSTTHNISGFDAGGSWLLPRNSTLLLAKPLEKDVNAVFSKVSSDPNSGGGSESGAGASSSDSSSDAHPLLGITPAAPGDPFDFNPILSNPAVTRILAGSSGRIPQWEPNPDSHDPHLPEVNYTGNTNSNSNSNTNNRNRIHLPLYHQQSSTPLPNSNSNILVDRHQQQQQQGIGSSGSKSISHNPKNPVFVPSPVSSNGSPTMYNMDQMTNNIAIPKHTLSNPSNLATSRSTNVGDDGAEQYYHSNNNNRDGGGSGGRRYDSANYNTDHHNNEHEKNNNYNSNYGPNNYGNHLDDVRDGNRGGGGDGGPYAYDDDEHGYNEENGRNELGLNGEAQGKKGLWKENGQTDSADSRHENGFKYVAVCDALCGAWKHQCKLMGILFSITSVLCLGFAFVILYSVHFRLKDFVPFSIILLLLFTTSTSRAFLLLSGWFCAPDSRPSWLPIVSTLPSTFFTLTILVLLRMARFPFPFVKSYTVSCQTLSLLSLLIILPPLAVSTSASFQSPSHAMLTKGAWIAGHIVLIIISILYLWKFKSFYSRISHERGTSAPNGALNSCSGGYNGTILSGTSTSSLAIGNNNLSSAVKKRGLVVKWGCLQARAMFGTALLALALSTMIIISVAMNRGECENSSTWIGWILSLCARMLEFAIVILLLLVTITSADIRFFRRLTRGPINKTNGGLMNSDIFPTMLSSNAAVQRCIPMYSRDGGDQTQNRSSLRGKSFGERALPGERVGEYRSSVGRGLPLRLGNGPSKSLPVTPIDGFPSGMRLPEPAPASLLVTKMVFGQPAVSREVNLNHQLENPMLCTSGPGTKDERETSNIYASLESVKVPMMNPSSSTGSNHSGSDRVLLSGGPRDYIYSISRDLTRTIDSVYDSSRPRSTNLPHAMDAYGAPLSHTIEQIGSIPNLNGLVGRPTHFNFHPHHNLHMPTNRQELARTIDRIRYAAATAAANSPFVSTPNNLPGRNFMLQLGGCPAPSHLAHIGNPPPYCSGDSSHDVTPDSGIVADLHPKRPEAEALYAREKDYKRNSSIEDIRRLPILPLPKQHRTPGSTPLYDRTPTTPTNPSSLVSSPATALQPSPSPLYIPNPTPSNSIVGRVEHLLNQTEHILSRTESLDGNSHSAGIQRLLTHKEQLETVEKLLAQAEYAIWLEKKNCAQQVSQMSPTDSAISPYGCSQPGGGNASSQTSFNMSANSSQQPLLLSPKEKCYSTKNTTKNHKHNSTNTPPVVINNSKNIANTTNNNNNRGNSINTNSNTSNNNNHSSSAITHSATNNHSNNAFKAAIEVQNSINNHAAHGGVTSGHYNSSSNNNSKKITTTLEEESVV